MKQQQQPDKKPNIARKTIRNDASSVIDQQELNKDPKMELAMRTQKRMHKFGMLNHRLLDSYLLKKVYIPEKDYQDCEFLKKAKESLLRKEESNIEERELMEQMRDMLYEDQLNPTESGDYVVNW